MVRNSFPSLHSCTVNPLLAHRVRQVFHYIFRHTDDARDNSSRVFKEEILQTLRYAYFFANRGVVLLDKNN